MIGEADGGEEKLLSEDFQAQSASGADRCSSLPHQEDALSDSEGRMEAGLEMETSAEGGFRTPPMGHEAAEEPRGSLDFVIVPTSKFKPDWLPAGWTMEVRVRNSGISAGTKDKYYYDPVSHRRFRSKREVFDFLESGKTARHKAKTKLGPFNPGIMPKTSTPSGNDASQTMAYEADVNKMPLPSSRSCKQDFSPSSKHEIASKFDYLNRPEKVKWVLTNAAEGSWTPFIAGKEVSDSSKEIWKAAFESICNGNHNSQR